MDFMHKDIMVLRSQVIESKVKPSHPVGELSVDAFGRTRTYVDRGHRLRCLLAMGRVDYGESDDSSPGSRASRCWAPPPTILFWMWRAPPGG